METTHLQHDPLLDEPSTSSMIEPRSVRPQVQDDEIDLLDLLIVLAKRKRLILGVTLGSAVLAAIVSLLLPNRYTATTKILPPQQSQSGSTMLLNQLAGGGMGPLAAIAGSSLGIKNPSDIYIGILKSRTIQDSLLSQFELMRVYRDKRASDARKDLAGYSDILAEKEGLISISVEDKDPKRAAAMANAYVNELRKVTQHLAISEASQRRLFFEQQVQQAKEDLSNAEVALKETQQKTGMFQLDSQAKAIIEAIGNLRAQVAAKEVQLQAMRSFATEQNPQRILVQEQVVGLREQLRKLEGEEGGEGDPIVGTGKIPGVGLEFVRKYRDVKYYETIFELLAKQYEAAKIDESREAAVIQVLDQAMEPDRKSSPKRLVIVVVSTAVAFLGAVFFCICKQALANVRQDPKRAARIEILRHYFRIRGAREHSRL
ncbi:MAG TPA: Wzz/FepE/Etk N-terminal domain-containing protein [Terriglobales bacterium]|jgi:tyrosine-protein kinase Etk/Wzc|nr:Wzz/FepE/Etk N-terminal domain-containing protein [Terriglobales bacterium]